VIESFRRVGWVELFAKPIGQVPDFATVPILQTGFMESIA